jgi:hypothetical protein
LRIEKIIEIEEFTSVIKSPSTQDLLIKATIPPFGLVFSHSVIP